MLRVTPGEVNVLALQKFPLGERRTSLFFLILFYLVAVSSGEIQELRLASFIVFSKYVEVGSLIYLLSEHELSSKRRAG